MPTYVLALYTLNMRAVSAEYEGVSSKYEVVYPLDRRRVSGVAVMMSGLERLSLPPFLFIYACTHVLSRLSRALQSSTAPASPVLKAWHSTN